jgi:hypothetical protein
MHKLLLSAILVFIGCSFLSAIMQGGGGFTSSTLAAGINATSTSIPIADTSSFANEDIITIDSEQILYTSRNDTGVSTETQYRGYSGTTATAHSTGATVYTEEAGVINSMLGFNIALQVQTGGIYGILQLPFQFLLVALPHLISLNLSILAIPELSIIGICWFGFGIALLVVLTIQLGPTAVALLAGLAGLAINGLRGLVSGLPTP